MESRIVISCSMLMDEVSKVCENKNDLPEIIWMKRGMHKDPEQLKKSLQQVIDSCKNKDTILLTYGLCGRSTLGLYSETARLVLPRFHDCIHQLCRKPEETGHLYLTRGWTLDAEGIYQQSQLVLRKYGREYGMEILRGLYGGYDTIDVIDTGAYPVEPVMEHARRTAELLGKRANKIPGSTVILEKLFTGNWDEDFIVLEPGERLTLKHFGILAGNDHLADGIAH